MPVMIHSFHTNTDCKLITCPNSAYSYLTKYVTKMEEKSFQLNEIIDNVDCNEDTKAASWMIKMMNRYIGKRDWPSN